jgi:hypothetical protein
MSATIEKARRVADAAGPGEGKTLDAPIVPTAEKVGNPRPELQMQVTQFENVESMSLKELTRTWPQICESLGAPNEYENKDACRLLKLATFGTQRTKVGSLRHDANVLEVFGIEGDYDAEKVTLDQAAALLKAAGIECFLYTTACHGVVTPGRKAGDPPHSRGGPRWRVLAPLSKACPPADRARYVRVLDKALGGILARESFALSQIFYVGKVKGVGYESQRVEGQYIDLLPDAAPVADAPAQVPDGPPEPASVATEPQVPGVSLDRLRLFLTAIPDATLGEYWDWLRVGMALHHATGGADEGLALWDECSARAPKYQGLDELEAKWATFGRESGELSTVSSIEHLADRDTAAWAEYDAAEFADVSGQQPAPSGSRHFSVVDPLALLDMTPASSPAWLWHGYVPSGHVTLIGAHGGTGKSTLALLLAAAVAYGLPCLGRETRQGRVLIYSAEDPADPSDRASRTMQGRLRLALDEIGVSQAQRRDLGDRLRILDATRGDPVLYEERRAGGISKGAPAPAMAALRQQIKEFNADLVIVDNSSDVYAANEIDRAQVRGFMRSLTQLVRDRDAAVILLAHLPKVSTRSDGDGGENYSGSTAWHNSARSRLFMRKVVVKGQAPGQSALLELLHEKCNLGPLLPTLRLEWPENGIMRQAGVEAEGSADETDMRALVRLIGEATLPSQWVSPATSGTRCASSMLSGAAGYPAHRRPREVAQLLAKAEALGYLTTEQYRSAGRHQQSRWVVTEPGRAFVGLEELAH